ncbi:hypothetical protein R3P38DRAFT_3254165 [Favolaschia claudopus]|uniref:P-loop containing nucleoside triphosphate hydrolase protein n=1 Tax=Favolaschia claudopus TaxID=2862362 RepID=A0AAW0DLF9_9AGAR
MSFLNRLLHAPPPSHPQPHPHAPGHIASSLGLGSFRDAFTFLSSSYVGSSLKLFVLGLIVETGRRLFRWLIERFSIKYCTTIRFIQGDPAYEWIVLFLNQEKVYRRSREFTVSAANSQRKWSVAVPSPSPFPFPAPGPSPSPSTPAKQNSSKQNAEFVPLYTQPQLFRWRGYWVEIKRNGAGGAGAGDSGGYGYAPGGAGRYGYGGVGGSISITVYTLDMTVLSDLVEDARLRYLEVNRPNVVIHLTDSPQFGPHQTWASVKHKIRRPLSSIILPEGVVDALVKDAQEFLSTENWYNEAGIPHRRGYLLYGPPGTGKTSTIYALAGALNLEIYSLSLASNFVDDSYLQRAASAIPKHGLFLIEDIDCAFPSREDEDEEFDNQESMMNSGMHPAARRRGRGGGPGMRSRSLVTLSGLLNVIDGIGSEEGKLFFATTNHIDRLDAALLRPGRIDHKVQYGLATEAQAHALFMRFFPAWRFSDAELAVAAEKFNAAQNQIRTRNSTSSDEKPTSTIESLSSETRDAKPSPTLTSLAQTFSSSVPAGEFSTAELQGYLQGYKLRPHQAATGVSAWAASVRKEREERVRREAERRAKLVERRKAMMGQGVVVNVNGQGVGQGMGMGGMPGVGAGMPGMPGAGMPGTPGAGMPMPMPMTMSGFPTSSMGAPTTPGAGMPMRMPMSAFPMPPMGFPMPSAATAISPAAAPSSPNGQAAPPTGMAPTSQTVVVVPTAETIVSGAPAVVNGGDANHEGWENIVSVGMVNGAPHKGKEKLEENGGRAGEAAAS